MNNLSVQKTKKNKILNIAHIGAGRMGKRWVPVIAKNKDVRLKYVSDTGTGHAQELAAMVPGCTATSSINLILNSCEIDAIIVSTPHRFLSEITASALNSGKHVLCEKPGAIKSLDIKKNILLAKENHLTYMVGYNHRFHDAFLKARRLFDKGAIGKLVFIRARYGFGGRTGYNLEWRLSPTQSGGGHLIDQGVHMIDLALSFMGGANKVQGFTSDTFWKKGAEDNAFVLLWGRNKTIASIHTSLTQWKPMHSFEIYGTDGYLTVDGLGMKYGGQEKLIIGKRTESFSRDIKEKVILCNSVADDSLSLELKEFILAIRQKRDPKPSPLDAYDTLRIVEQVYSNNKL